MSSPMAGPGRDQFGLTAGGVDDALASIGRTIASGINLVERARAEFQQAGQALAVWPDGRHLTAEQQRRRADYVRRVNRATRVLQDVLDEEG